VAFSGRPGRFSRIGAVVDQGLDLRLLVDQKHRCSSPEPGRVPRDSRPKLSPGFRDGSFAADGANPTGPPTELLICLTGEQWVN